MLPPPLLWLGIVYLGSLFALLLQSFFSIDEFSGLINREFTLKTYGELLQPANLDIIVRTVTMAALVTLASAVVAFPIAYYAARYARGKWKALFYLGVMLPLWSSYLVKIYAWKLILAKEGILTWLFEQAASDAGCSTPGCRCRCRRQLAVGQLHRHLPRLRLCLAAVHDPADPGGARARAGQPHRGLGRSRRRRRPDLPQRDLAAGAARHRRRLDLHLLADARRLHHPADHRHVARCSSARRSTRSRARPATSRSPPPSPWCRSSSWASTSGSPSAWGRSMRSDRRSPRRSA